MRILADAPLGRRDADLRQQLDGAIEGRALGEIGMGADGLAELPADGEAPEDDVDAPVDEAPVDDEPVVDEAVAEEAPAEEAVEEPVAEEAPAEEPAAEAEVEAEPAG